MPAFGMEFGEMYQRRRVWEGIYGHFGDCGVVGVLASLFGKRLLKHDGLA